MSKLDPFKMFPALSYSRRGIAEIVSQIIEIDDDDPRLTDAVCQEFVDSIHESLLDASSVDLYEIEYEVAEEFVRQRF